MLAASARWGEGLQGRAQIPHPVCKVKYQPSRPKPDGDGVQLLFACHLHHEQREARIARCAACLHHPSVCPHSGRPWCRPRPTAICWMPIGRVGVQLGR
jgi:hypothetical protein